MNNDMKNRPLGELVTENPNRAELFETLGLDYCCGGKETLANACMAKQLSPDSIVDRILTFDNLTVHQEKELWGDAPPSLLADHIVGTHHVYLKREFPRMEQLLAKVVSVHGAHHPALMDVQRVFALLYSDAKLHLLDEELTTFPAIRRLEAGTITPADRAELVAGLDKLMTEHVVVGGALAEIRRLTDGYTLPEDGCQSYHTLLHWLLNLENDFHIHVHKENNIMFPKVQQLLNS